jgi:glycosyltransferase involved in cell wall biosynthesis
MTLLEAMAHGVPFVATSVGEVPALAAGGRIVAVDDADALATTVAELVNDAAERMRLGAAARALAETEYSRRVVDAAMYDVYDVLRGVDA